MRAPRTDGTNHADGGVPDVLNNNAEDLRRDIYTYLGGRLPRYKIPESIAILPALPKTATGKIARAELRKLQ